MAYGDHTTAYKLLTNNATEARILTSGEYAPARGIGEMGTVTFIGAVLRYRRRLVRRSLGDGVS